MTRTRKCDVCKRCEPEVDVKYSRRKKWWGLFERQGSSQGADWFELDICESCWGRICKKAKGEG